ncbi:MAG: hypothetical protein JWO12_2402 [Frankiales bacterium]|nr:hypothetical protein [Frankiales bacterium]
MKRIVLSVLALLLLTAAPVSAASTVTANESNNAKSLTVHVGDTVVVRLKSAAWTINDADGKVLVAAGQQQDSPGRPGPGCCGTASRSFTAKAAGTAALTADRTSCGEALKCSPEQSRYSVRVVVLGLPSKLPFTGFSVPRTVLLGLLLLGSGLVVVGAGRLDLTRS